MPQDKMMQAIGRMERALARLEGISLSPHSQIEDVSDMQRRHDQLKMEAQATVGEIDRLLSQIGG